MFVVCLFCMLFSVANAYKIEIAHPPVGLGEGPHWDNNTQTLYFVDIFNQTIHKYKPSTKSRTQLYLEGGPVTFVIPVENSDRKVVASIGRKLYQVTYDRKNPTRQIIAEVDYNTKNRFNDGKADPSGRLFAGTMGPEVSPEEFAHNQAFLYSLENDCQLITKLAQVSISNGLAWNPSIGKMYYADSGIRKLIEYDYDVHTGQMWNFQYKFDLDDHDIPGIFDGMTIDSNGNLWLAIYDGSRVINVDPRDGKLLRTIRFNTPQITSAAFGGPDLDELYVTSAQVVDSNGVRPKYPAGALFRVKGLGVRGFPGVPIKLSSLENCPEQAVVE